MISIVLSSIVVLISGITLLGLIANNIIDIKTTAIHGWILSMISNFTIIIILLDY